MNSEIRVGLLGYGIAGAVFHAPLIAATPGLALTSVVTTDPAKRERLRREHPGTTALDSAEQLFAGEHDLVVVATPNRTHVELATTALEHGLPVVVDKPFAPTSAQARELAALAEARGLPLSVFQNRRWDGDFRTVRKLVEDGELGRVLRFESRFDRWVPTPKQGWREHAGAEEAGGVLFDLGAHLVDQALDLFGPVRSVYAEVSRLRPGVQVDDDFFVALQHVSGVRSHLWSSSLAAQRGARFRVLGDQGAYVKHGLDGQEAALKAGARPGSPEWGQEPEDRWGTLGVEGSTRQVETERGAYENFYRGMVAAIQDGAPVPVAPTEAVAALEIIEAARSSAGCGRVVELDATP
ncbi:Gfo/Idh/MocA family oxidoreductase [Allokutzneria sp. A3M-2-11 16]|uniref:Gfo/Idh/MocA family protein n=1 Tax=Allokutzneria sp. A3M-2-11 16 TaxID=2962043 RepID=UPI0020B66A92|nr:Gfo/Idh/MocA family oxidoreductase [Allokutzneria sp. A3M-2-11 16]MCP3804316.1 Gfo/Idh/MocA family oxidoreductase [Allokutzneria sp. A3M-2-11 16]